MDLSDRYPVYSANSSRCLWWMLILLVLVCFYISAETGFVWMYGVSVVLLGIAGYFFSLLCSTVSFSEEGIRLRYGFFRVYTMEWKDVLCCGTFAVTILGASGKEEFLYFSKKPCRIPSLSQAEPFPLHPVISFFLGNRKRQSNPFTNSGKTQKLDSLTDRITEVISWRV